MALSDDWCHQSVMSVGRADWQQERVVPDTAAHFRVKLCTLLKRIWTDEDEDPEVQTLYQYVIDLTDRVEETCQMVKEELAKVQVRNQKYYNKRTRDRKLQVGNSVLLLLPTERNKLNLAWRGPYKVVGIVGDFDYRVEVSPDKVKTYHINMLKRYYHCESATEPTFNGSRASPNCDDNDVINENQDADHQAASVACVIEEEVSDEVMSGKDVEALLLYNVRQKETVDDVIINPQLSAKQRNQVRYLLVEYKEIFSDVPKVTYLIEHKVELTENEPVKRKPYPIPYKMQEVIDKEIEDMLAMEIIEPFEAPYASPLALVKKPDGSYRVRVNFKDLNKITVFDPEPLMSPDDIFPKLTGSQLYSTFDFCKEYWAIHMAEESKDFTNFVTSKELMRFKVMPFGMVNSRSTDNRILRKLLEGAQDLESYVDNVLGHTKDWNRHI